MSLPPIPSQDFKQHSSLRFKQRTDDLIKPFEEEEREVAYRQQDSDQFRARTDSLIADFDTQEKQQESAAFKARTDALIAPFEQQEQAPPEATVTQTMTKTGPAPVQDQRKQTGRVEAVGQFEQGLADEEAYSICGPVAALAFAQQTGRNPTLQEARVMARKVGWTAEGGMNGIGNQKRLLDGMGVSSRLDTDVDFGEITADAASGNPVIVSTAKHYYYVNGYDPETGKLHVGKTGTARKGGATWMSPQEIANLDGGINGALYVDNPSSPEPSVAARPIAGPVEENAPPVAAEGPYPGSLPAGFSATAPAPLGVGREEEPSIQPPRGTPLFDQARRGLGALADAAGAVIGPGMRAVAPGLVDALPAIDQGLKTAGDFLGDRVVEAGAKRQAWYAANLSVFTKMQRGEEPTEEEQALANDPEMVLMMSPESLAGKAGKVAGEVVTEAVRTVPRIVRPASPLEQAGAALRRQAGNADEAAELRPPGEGYAANINLEKFPEEIRPLLEDGARAFSNFAGQRRGVISDPEALQNAARAGLAMDPEDWIKTRPGRAFNQEQAIALGQTLTRSGETYSAARKAYQEAVQAGTDSPDMAAKLAEQALEFAALEGVRSGAAAEAGRALRSFRLALTAPAASRDQAIARAFKLVGGGERFKEFATAFDRIPEADRLAQYKMLQGLHTPTWWDRLNILRYGSMLSASSTHLTNAVSNAVGTLADIGMKPLQGALDAAVSKVGGGERTRYAAETLPQAKAAAAGFWTGVKEAGAILRDGVSPDDLGKLEVRRPGFQSGSGKADAVIEMPLRALAAADNIFRSASQGGHIAALAHRQAYKEGLTGAARVRRADEIVSNITDYPELLQQADTNAARVVLQEARAEIAPLLSARSTNAKYVLDFFLPFVRTPYNIAAQGAGLTPAGFLSVANAARNGNRGEAVDRAVRSGIGTAAMGTAAVLAANGYMTGGWPDDDAERSTLPPGWRPWSLRLPNVGGEATYIEFRNLGPWAIPLAIGAVAGDAYKRGQELNDPPAIAMNAVKAIGAYMRDQTFLQGLSNIEKAIADPERYAENILEGIATSFVPFGSLQRQIDRALGNAQKDPHGALEALMATSPLTSGGVADRLTPMGEPVRSSQTGVSAFVAPVRFDIANDEPTLAILRAAKLSIPRVGKEYEGLKLSDDDRREVQQRAGELLRSKLGRMSERQATRNPGEVERIRNAAFAEAREPVLRKLRRSQRPATSEGRR